MVSHHITLSTSLLNWLESRSYFTCIRCITIFTCTLFTRPKTKQSVMCQALVVRPFWSVCKTMELVGSCMIGLGNAKNFQNSHEIRNQYMSNKGTHPKCIYETCFRESKCLVMSAYICFQHQIILHLTLEGWIACIYSKQKASYFKACNSVVCIHIKVAVERSSYGSHMICQLYVYTCTNTYVGEVWYS